MPTAISLTPDQAMLLVGDGQLRFSRSFHCAADGSLVNGEPYYRVDIPENTPASEVAGVTVDSGGQVYFAQALGIQVCEANGRCAQIPAKPEPGQLTSLTWLKGLVLGEMPIDDAVFRHLKPLRQVGFSVNWHKATPESRSRARRASGKPCPRSR